MPLIKKKLKKPFDIINLQEDFNPILSFLSEFCEVPYAFVSLIGKEGQIVKAEIGFDSLILPENIVALSEEIIQLNKITIVSNSSKEEESKRTNPSLFPFNFFAGFPICTDENIVVGTLCIMDNRTKELSPLQLKSLNQSVLQIQSLLKLHVQNKDLEEKVYELKNKIQAFIDNSNEIFYEVSMDGLITNASESWTRILGHDLSTVIGKRNEEFIHPEDFEKCNSILMALSLGEQNAEELIYRIEHHDGHYLWHSSTIKLVTRDGIPFYEGSCSDITDSVNSQQKLIQQKEFYEKILDRLPSDVSVFDGNFKYLYVNPSSIKDDELRKFIIGENYFEYSKRKGRDDVLAENRRKKFLEALESRNTIEWEDTIDGYNGEITHHTRKFTPVFYEDGSLEMMVGFGVDITESKKNQNEILKSRKHTQNIIQNLGVGVLVYNSLTEVIENNILASEMLGLSQDQLLNKTPYHPNWNVIHWDGSKFLPDDFPITQSIKESKSIRNIAMGVHRPKYDDLIWLLVDTIPISDEFGEFLYVICSFTDITSQKIAEESLKISNERLNYSNMATSDALWDWNFITDEVFVGERFFNLFGYNFANNVLTGTKFKNFSHPEDIGDYLDKMNQFINNDDFRLTTEYRFLKSDGTYAFVKDKAVVIRNKKGKAIRMIGGIQDITSEKILKVKLQQSEERFKGAFDNTALGMGIVNSDGYWIEVNNRICEILGYSKEELKTMQIDDITYFEDLEMSLANKEKLVNKEISNLKIQKRYVHKNKSLIWVELSVTIVENKLEKNEYFVVQFIDISERKRIEEENKYLIDENNRNKANQLNEAKNMYRLLAENTVDLICLHNINGSFIYVSPSIHKLLGYTPEELLGKFPEEFVHPEDVEILRNSFNYYTTEKENITPEIRYRNKKGSYFWLESKAILVKENGIPSGFQSSTRDITQRKIGEKIIKDTLIQERELNELRTNLVSTISHEFRTPMTTIRTSAELIALYLEGQNFDNSLIIEKRLNSITEQIDRIVELMNTVLIIFKEESGKTSFNPVTFDLKQLCFDVIDLNFNNFDNKRKVVSSFYGDSFYMFADKNLMEYCIINILNNAFKYSKGLKDIILKVNATHDTIVIEIIDFGIGIPKEDQPKLFNTFFRGNNTDGFQGTGLGLYIVKTFAEKNSGTVEIESQLGKGTNVTLKFPLITE
jgi:PAS domain S-box-containing protein